MSTVVLEWEYSPPEYFESPIKIAQDDYIMEIADGKAVARIDSAVYDANRSVGDALHYVLTAQFIGVQLVNHKAYNLSRSTMTRVHPDGRKNYFLKVETGRLKLKTHPIDFQLLKKGEVVFDSKLERRREELFFTDQISKHPNDEVLKSLLQSYNASVEDSNNELVHLYEIRDALVKKFGNHKNTKLALNISNSDWSYFGKLCDDDPLRQGRHRGKHFGSLRNATKAELSKVRRIAKDMIKGYILYLETAAR